MQKITPFLWFNDQAEEAMNFYLSVFKDSKAGKVSYGPAAPGEKQKVLSATFVLNGQEFYALNGGPHYSFTPAVSFFIHCKDQEEVDYYWNRLLEGGREDRCGWLNDKFGLSWQVIPDALGRLLGDPDREKANKVLKAMLQMRKIEVAKLEAAYRS